MTNRLLIGDCRERLATLPAGRAHTCVTSPPYWGLRDYGHEGQVGLEETPEEYVEKMVEVFREVRRVLRDDGTLWLNLGDSYCGGGGYAPDAPCNKRRAEGNSWGAMNPHSVREGHARKKTRPGYTPPGLKPKDLVGIPWRVAFALQADGWYLRSDVIWHKPNPMPESVTDRPTKAHEYVFLLSKSRSYYYDADAISERSAHPGSPLGCAGNPKRAIAMGRAPSGNEKPGAVAVNAATRNKRTVWTIASQPYSEAHFATYPPDLIKPCIMAGTSEAGCCADCGAPREREVERERMVVRPGPGRSAKNGANGDLTRTAIGGTVTHPATSRTTGWRPACSCGAAAAPCVVLDPFMGSGTTAQVAQDLGRHWIGCELNPDYEPLIRRRTAQASLDLMAGREVSRG